MKGLDLRTATGILNVTGKTMLNLPMSITVEGANLDIPIVLGIFESPCKTTAGRASIFTFNINANRTLTGVYNCNQTWVWQSGIKVKGVIEVEGGFPVVPTGDITVKTGTATMVVPFAEIVLGNNKWRFRGTAPGVSRLSMDNKKHTFYMKVSREEGIGIPPVGPGQPISHLIQVQFQIPTADGVITFDSTLQILRRNSNNRTWNR